MPKRIKPGDDQWFGVNDTRKRKQIQDRLAQRARRLRLAKSTNQLLTSPTPSDSGSSQNQGSEKENRNQPPNGTSYQFSARGLAIPSPGSTLSFDQTHLSSPTHSVFSALHLNGIILGIPCVTSAISRSRPAPPHVPPPLHPLQIQLDNVHYQFIDRLPMQAVRYSMITLSDFLNVEDFVADIFTMESFIIAPGFQSWDPNGWKVSPQFRSKWRVLFESEVLKGATSSTVMI